MTHEERMSSFLDLLFQTHRLYAWTYDADMQLLHTTYPEDDYQGYDNLFQIQVAPMITAAKANYTPHIIYSFFNLAWLIDFEVHDGKLQKVYVLGPTFTGENSYNELVKEMDRRHLSIKTKSTVAKTLKALPIIASNILYTFVSELHYLLYGSTINVPELIHMQNSGTAEAPSPSPVSNRHHGIWAAEQRFLQLFKDGNPDFQKALLESSHLSSGVQHNSKDSLRAAKNNSFVLLTLISRASIDGGVSPDIAYDLCDFFAQRIEDAASLAENSDVTTELLQIYFKKVCESKQNDGVSSIVKNCCDYIGIHINEKLSINELAERAGYSEYYFSRKFKQEMGCTLTEYIMREKIERAKVLLSTTSMSIMDISIELSFNSRSYFSDTFQKNTGISPGEYRKQNVRL